MAEQRARDLGWLVTIALVALNLRAAITSVPPLAVDLGVDLGLGAVAIGALTTIPVACMGLFAPVAAWFTRWLDPSTVLTAGIGLIAAGAGVRAVGGVVPLYLGTALAGIGIAVVGTLLPGLVRTRVPDRVGPVTGIYTAALITGAFIASSLAEPVRIWLDASAQAALAVWAGPAVVALVVWAMVSRPIERAPTTRPRPAGDDRPSPWRDSSAWVVTGFMAVQSLLFYGALAWLPVSAIAQGMSAQEAGLLLGLFTVTQVLTAFVVPALAHRTGDMRPWVVLTVSATTAGLALVALVPYGFPGALWLWAALQGLGMGGHFALALNAITQVAPSTAAVPAYSGMAFLFGYSLAAIGPVLLGFLADASGGYRLPFLTLTGFGLITLVLGVAAASRAQARAQARAR